MKLTVRRPGHIPIRIILPTGLLFGRVSAAILAQALRQNNIPVSAADVRTQLAAIPWKDWRGLCLVQAELADGGSVRLIV